MALAPRSPLRGLARRAASSSSLDLLVRDVRVVRPDDAIPLRRLDVGISGGKFVEFGEAGTLDGARAARVHDAHGLLGFPGVCDAHCHVGIYNELETDALSESRAAAQGGVTSLCSYMRTGQYYLDMGGPWAEFIPELLRRSEGNYFVDYTYHLAPIEAQHIGEMEAAAAEHGVGTFKIFMFYGGHGLHGPSDCQRDFLMIGPDERYDLAHFESVRMRTATRSALSTPRASSVHC